MFWQESRPRPQPAPLALFPQLHLWSALSGVWEFYINSWDYLALIKIHKQLKCKFICSSQQNVSLISWILTTANAFWAVAFEGKIIGLQIIFPSRKLFCKWTVMLRRLYTSTWVFCNIFRGTTCSNAGFCILPFRMLASLLHCMYGSVRLFNTFSQKEISQQKRDALLWSPEDKSSELPAANITPAGGPCLHISCEGILDESALNFQFTDAISSYSLMWWSIYLYFSDIFQVMDGFPQNLAQTWMAFLPGEAVLLVQCQVVKAC